MSFTIGRLARLTGLTVRALHHYDAIGLLSPSQRSAGGYRLYTRDDVTRLFRIQALQGVGLSLADIAGVLARDGAGLPDLIDQQLAAVELQIQHATALANRLRQLQEIVLRGDDAQTSDWLGAVELITQYGSYCSHEEVQRLLARDGGDAHDWHEFVSDLTHALDTQLAPDSKEARRLLERWRALLLRWAGGDPALAIKMKRAYSKEDSIRSRVELQGGISPDMMAYLGEVMVRLHRELWASHLPARELARLRIRGRWAEDLLPAIAALREAAQADSNAEARERALASWHALLWEFADEDSDLAGSVQATLLDADADPELSAMWFLPDDLRLWLTNASPERIDAPPHPMESSHVRLQ